MEKTAEFNNLLVEFAAQLMKVAPSMIGSEIDRILKAAGEFWQVDQVLLAELPDKHGKMRIIHSYVAEGMPTPSPAYASEVPWFIERIKAGLPVSASKLADDLPSNADAEKRFGVKEHVRSFLALPYVIGESVRGTLIFNSLRAERPWPEELIRQAHQFGEILASSLERGQSAKRIEELQRFERLLSEISAKYINLSVEEIEQSATQDFGSLAALLEVDRCALHLFDEGSSDWKTASSEVLTQRWLRQLAWLSDEDKAEIDAQLDLMRRKPEVFSGLRYVLDKWSRGECHQWTFSDDLPEDARELKDFSAQLGIKSGLVVPVFASGSTMGVVVVATTRTHRV